MVDVDKGAALAYTLMVDAVSGEVLYRENQVEHSSDVEQFQGELTADACGPKHPFELTDDKTQTITIAASAVNVANDIVVKLYGPGNALLSSGDLATSPETLSYSPGGTIPQGIYQAEVCPFEDPTVPFAPPGTYAGVVSTSDSGAEAPTPNLPRWRYFTANPSLDYSARHHPEEHRGRLLGPRHGLHRPARPRAALQRPVGLRPRLQGADVHHPRQQRQRP